MSEDLEVYTEFDVEERREEITLDLSGIIFNESILSDFNSFDDDPSPTCATLSKTVYLHPLYISFHHVRTSSEKIYTETFRANC